MSPAAVIKSPSVAPIVTKDMVDQSRGDKPQKRHGAPGAARLMVTVFAAV